MNSSLARILTESAQRRRDHPALKLGDAVTTYDELDAGSARVAGVLAAKGVAPGDRVGLMMPNVPDFGLAFYGACARGPSSCR